MSKSDAGKGDRPRNCFSSAFKTNYEQINWGRTPKKKVNRHPNHLLELLNAIIDSPEPIDINDDHKVKDFDVNPVNEKRDKLFLKYSLDESIRDKYIWEVTELMANHG